MSSFPFPTSTFFSLALKILSIHLAQDVHNQILFNWLLKPLDYGKSMQYLSQAEQTERKLEASGNKKKNHFFANGKSNAQDL